MLLHVGKACDNFQIRKLLSHATNVLRHIDMAYMMVSYITIGTESVIPDCTDNTTNDSIN